MTHISQIFNSNRDVSSNRFYYFCKITKCGPLLQQLASSSVMNADTYTLVRCVFVLVSLILLEIKALMSSHMYFSKNSIFASRKREVGYVKEGLCSVF